MNVTGGEYDADLPRLLSDYPDFRVRAAFESYGYRAQMRGPHGGLVGHEMSALTLDELAARMDTMRAEVIRLDDPPAAAGASSLRRSRGPAPCE